MGCMRVYCTSLFEIFHHVYLKNLGYDCLEVDYVLFSLIQSPPATLLTPQPRCHRLRLFI